MSYIGKVMSYKEDGDLSELSHKRLLVVSTKRNHNGLHLKTVNLATGGIGYLNDIESNPSKSMLCVKYNSLDEYEAMDKNAPVKDWIQSKIDYLSTKPY